MNLRYWNKQHTLGLLIGLLSILISIPIIEYIYTLIDHSKIIQFSYYWDKFFFHRTFRSKVISLSAIPNLIWFYLSLNKRNYNFSMGIILSTILLVPYVIYTNFF